MQELTDAARTLLQNECSSAQVRAVEAGGSPRALWQHLEASGFADALLDADAGGAGLRLHAVFGLWALCGSHLLPVPLGETMLARTLLHRAGCTPPPGPIALAQARRHADGSVHCAHVPLGRVAEHVLVQHAHGWLLLPAAQATRASAVFSLDAPMRWSAAHAAAHTPLPIALPTPLQTLHACLLAAYMAGALLHVLQRTLQYANERQQFGRPIGKFQAVQHQCAVMSEQVYAAHMAAHMGTYTAEEGSFWPDPLRAAIAKARCSQAALAVCEIAHAVHGAIGFTQEYDLQLYTRRLHAWRLAAGSESHWHAAAGRALLDGHNGSTLDLLRQVTDVC